MDPLEDMLLTDGVREEILRETGLSLDVHVQEALRAPAPGYEAPGFHGVAETVETIYVFLKAHGSVIGGAIGMKALDAITNLITRRFQDRTDSRGRLGIPTRTIVRIYGPDNRTVVSEVEVENEKPPRRKR